MAPFPPPSPWAQRCLDYATAYIFRTSSARRFAMYTFPFSLTNQRFMCYSAAFLRHVWTTARLRRRQSPFFFFDGQDKQRWVAFETTRPVLFLPSLVVFEVKYFKGTWHPVLSIDYIPDRPARTCTWFRVSAWKCRAVRASDSGSYGVDAEYIKVYS